MIRINELNNKIYHKRRFSYLYIRVDMKGCKYLHGSYRRMYCMSKVLIKIGVYRDAGKEHVLCFQERRCK